MKRVARTRVPRRSPSERGQITAMLVIFSICLLIAIIAVTDISASYLRRQAATSLADGAALSASDAAAAASVYDGPPEAFVTLDQQAATEAVDSYLQQTGAYADYPGLQLDVVVDAHTVRIYLSMPYELPISMPGVDDSTTIHSSGSAVMPIY